MSTFKSNRNMEIYKLRKSGMLFDDIAKKFNITKQRAQQVFRTVKKREENKITLNGKGLWKF